MLFVKEVLIFDYLKNYKKFNERIECFRWGLVRYVNAVNKNPEKSRYNIFFPLMYLVIAMKQHTVFTL